MDERKNENIETASENEELLDAVAEAPNADEPLDKNVRLMSPTRMVLRRFFRSKLSIIGLIMVIGLFLFSFVGPFIYTAWGETELDESGTQDYAVVEKTFTTEDGKTYTIKQTTVTEKKDNMFAAPSSEHILGTDQEGYDIFARLMYGGRVSLIVSFLAVFLIAAMGIVLGGIAGYFGGWVDNVIMRICDILMCIPGLPILLIINLVLNSAGIDARIRIYLLMIYLTLFSWTGVARLVRGQILFLREQEYMVAAEAMGYSTTRKIFKHLIPNVMPQLIVSMSLSLGSMILYEATLSFLGLGVPAPYAAWGSMIEQFFKSVDVDPVIFMQHFNVWAAPGICIVIAVLGFNFVGDGLRDALDPKMRK